MTGLLPRLEIGYGSTWQTEPAAIVWTDETESLFRGPMMTVTRGASSARGEVDTGSASFSLANPDRRFDSLHVTGPLFGLLLPGTPFRITAVIGDPGSDALTWDGDPLTWDGDPLVWGFPLDEVPVINGTIPSWPQRYAPGGNWAFVPITGFDRFDKLSRAKIPRSVMESAIMPLAPVGFWPLDDPSGSLTASDTTGVNPGDVWDEPQFGQDPLAPGLGTSVEFDGVNDRIDITRSPLVANPNVSTVVAVVATKTPAEANTIHPIFTQVNGNILASTTLQLYVFTNGKIHIVGTVNGSGNSYETPVVTDGDAHLVFGERGGGAGNFGAAIDTATLSTNGITASAAGGNGVAIGGTPLAAKDYTDDQYVGRIGPVAVWDRGLTLAERQSIVVAYAALVGQTTDERITWILDEIGWPANLRDFEVGCSLLGPATFKAGDKALEYLRLVTATEDGLLYMAADGALTFRDRYWKYLSTLASVSQFTFTDDEDSPQYAKFDLDTDDKLLVNTARFTRRDGTEQVATDEASRALYGEAELQRTNLLHGTDAETRSLAEWTVATRSTPLPRVPSILIPLHDYSPADQMSILSLDLGHRVTCRRWPQEVGDPIEIDFLVDGLKHECNGSLWWVELYVSPVPQSTIKPFLWDDSLLDGADVWAY